MLQLLAETAALLAQARDIVDERVADDAVPSWSQARGWTSFLLSLAQDPLVRCETRSLALEARALPDAPASLVELAEAVRRLQESIPSLPQPPPAARVHLASPRKSSQLARVLEVTAALVDRARRIVDVGSGRGALASLIASSTGKPVLGIEIVEQRVESAARRASAPGVEYEQRDGVASGLGLASDDLAIGLHACGALGDALVTEAARVGSDVALITCCVQKIRGDQRVPLSVAARDAGLVFRREVLGLANLTPREQGVEFSTTAAMQAREARCAVRMALRARGVPVASGEEMRGLNRRRALRGSRELVTEAMAVRGLAPPTDQELQEAERLGKEAFERVRRLSLPRAMLGPIVELAVVLDRAAALHEAGHHVRVLRLFSNEESPRNLLVIASKNVTTPARPCQTCPTA